MFVLLQVAVLFSTRSHPVVVRMAGVGGSLVSSPFSEEGLVVSLLIID